MQNHLLRSAYLLSQRCLILIGFVVLVSDGFCASITLVLNNGDRITGEVVREDEKAVVLNTRWAKELTIPLSDITRREVIAAPVARKDLSVSTAEKTSPAEPTAVAKESPVAPPAKPAKGDVKAAPAPLTAKSKPPAASPKEWKGKVDIGTDLAFSEKNRQLYYGKAKITYSPSTPPGELKNIASRFRTSFDVAATFGRTDGVTSANRVEGFTKTDFDLSKRVFVYNLLGAGYDEIRRINYQYELGPGVGYRLITRSNFVMNTEIGMNYQVQNLKKPVGRNRFEDDNLERFSVRLAEEATWTLSKRLTLEEKIELYPSVDDFEGFRMRFEASLRYLLWSNISLSLSAVNIYDNQPAKNVSKNDLQIRSLIGINF